MAGYWDRAQLIHRTQPDTAGYGRIGRLDDLLNALVAVLDDLALARARQTEDGLAHAVVRAICSSRAVRVENILVEFSQTSMPPKEQIWVSADSIKFVVLL